MRRKRTVLFLVLLPICLVLFVAVICNTNWDICGGVREGRPWARTIQGRWIMPASPSSPEMDQSRAEDKILRLVPINRGTHYVAKRYCVWADSEIWSIWDKETVDNVQRIQRERGEMR